MCTALPPPRVNPIAVNKYIIPYHIFRVPLHFPKSIFDHISLVRYITAVEDSAKKWILLVNSVAEDIDLALSLSLSLSLSSTLTFKPLSLRRHPRHPAVTQLLATLPLGGFILD